MFCPVVGLVTRSLCVCGAISRNVLPTRRLCGPTARPTSWVLLLRFDKTNLSNKTQEVGLAVGPQSLRVGSTFLLIAPQTQSDLVTNPTTGQNILYGKREQLTLNAT